MRYYVEKDLRDFEFWGGAIANADLLTAEQLDMVDARLEDLLRDDYTATDVNDLFWFDFDKVCESIGLMYKDGNAYDSDSWAEHVHDIIKLNNPETVDIYWDDFSSSSEDLNPLDNDDEILEAWEDYVADNWLDHAESVLEENFPEVAGDDRSIYACEQWQNAKSDEWNIDEFKKANNNNETHNLDER